MTAPVLEVVDVRGGYGAIEVLKGLSLHVEQGEIVTLLGANGAGKTTALLTISGILAARTGAIRFQNQDISEMPAHEIVRLGISHVPEGRKIFGRMSVDENLELGAYSTRRSKRRANRSDRVFALFPVLAERRRQLGGTLSGGEQQMLAIGRALMSEPKLLLLDEPSMGVAPILTQKIFSTIQELNREGMTILLVEQNAHLALDIAHRGYVIELGSAVIAGSATELQQDERVRKVYLGEE